MNEKSDVIVLPQHEAPGLPAERPRSTAIAVGTADAWNTWQGCLDLATALAPSGLIAAALRGKPADIAIILLTGRELDLPPMLALRTISVVDGKPCIESVLIAALIHRFPMTAEFRCIESTDKLATYRGRRKDEVEPTEITYTIEDAKIAGLAGKQNWQKNPKAMLRARACAATGRVVFPDAIANLYSREELEDVVIGAVAREPAKAATMDPEAIEQKVSEVVAKISKVTTPDDLAKLATEIAKLGKPIAKHARVRAAYKLMHHELKQKKTDAAPAAESKPGDPPKPAGAEADPGAGSSKSEPEENYTDPGPPEDD